MQDLFAFRSNEVTKSDRKFIETVRLRTRTKSIIDENFSIFHSHSYFISSFSLNIFLKYIVCKNDCTYVSR